jgi:hypothetical protein
MTHFLRPALLASTLCSLLPTAACVISDGDDDDDGAGESSDGGSSPSTSNGTTVSSSDPGTTNPGTTDPGTTDPGTTNPGTTDPSTTDPGDSGTTDPSDSDSADETMGESGVDVDPQDGEWLYQESGGTMNACTFLEEPSNGFGEFELANTGGGAFTIQPNDGTDPFVCSHGGGSFDCDERLSGTYDIGMGLGEANGSILVAIEGSFSDAEHLSAEQQGRIECEGADCGTAEGLLGVTFPCAFTIPFTATAQ